MRFYRLPAVFLFSFCSPENPLQYFISILSLLFVQMLAILLLSIICLICISTWEKRLSFFNLSYLFSSDVYKSWLVPFRFHRLYIFEQKLYIFGLISKRFHNPLLWVSKIFYKHSSSFLLTISEANLCLIEVMSVPINDLISFGYGLFTQSTRVLCLYNV